MKSKTLFILVFLFSVLVVTAQNSNDNKDRTISVTGSASMNVLHHFTDHQGPLIVMCKWFQPANQKMKTTFVQFHCVMKLKLYLK